MAMQREWVGQTGMQMFFADMRVVTGQHQQHKQTTVEESYSCDYSQWKDEEDGNLLDSGGD